jgi:hypothetical protein
VFSWGELEPGSAYGTKRALLVFERGGEEALSAGDHFQLGLFALGYGRKDLASNEFREAIRRDRAYAPRVKKAYDDDRRQERVVGAQLGLAENKTRAANGEFSSENPGPTPGDYGPSGNPGVRKEAPGTGHSQSPIRNPQSPIPNPQSTIHNPQSIDRGERILEVYKAFGSKVQEVIGKDVKRIETDHFLIWTDFEARFRNHLRDWCESMYSALCAQFDLGPHDDVFPAKCPVFCWRSKARFLKFARLFDGYSGADAVGYTRSIEANGHVHVVLLRQGRSEADLDRFACTLVHEGTHAFLHRLHAPRLIPHWINEGYADLMAERLLGDRCPNGENARLLARQYVRYDWPITTLIGGVGPIDVHQYSLAHSLVAYLEGLGRAPFAGFIKDLKAGRVFADALAGNYDNLTVGDFESGWRAAVRLGDPALNVPHPSPQTRGGGRTESHPE